MSLRIIKAGLADAFYDQGRYGYQHLGINPAGAMDKVALQVANALVLNPPNTPILEMHFPAATIQFTTSALIALAGANFSPHINGEPVPIITPIAINSGSVLTFTLPKAGARIYLAISGGFKLSPWLGSCSTNLVCKAGGYQGRNLQAGDEIDFKPSIDVAGYCNRKPYRVLPVRANVHSLYHQPFIHLLPGLHLALMHPQSVEQLFTQPFIITAESNRMGYRLSGSSLHLQKQARTLSSAVVEGTIQLLPNGQLILLMAGHQTTGGYPVVGYVASAHIPVLAQCSHGQLLYFKQTTLAEAEVQLLNQQRHLLQLQNACTFRINHFLQNGDRRP